jgi:starch-binding outer membrane protein, SusD/RagB family
MAFGLTAVMTFTGCSLDEELRQNIDEKTAQQYLSGTGEAPNFDALLGTVYHDLQTFMSQDKIWAMQEHSSDELIPPTRAGDWDDGGQWRSLHSHIWTSEHPIINASFNNLMTGVYNATVVLGFDGVPADAIAKAKFLRSFILFHVLDNWGKFPLREPNSSPLEFPKTYEGEEAVSFLISEVESTMANLPDGPLPALANKDAARMLLAKLYLNKGAFLNREAPTFADADMDKVIQYTKEIMDGGNYSLMDKYFDNFKPMNGSISTENIFTGVNMEGVAQDWAISNGVLSRWFSTLHYSQNPGGWNGFATLADFYDKFSDNDMRKSYTDPDVQAQGGLTLGFLVGQQYKANGDPVLDENGKPLIFTKEVNLVEKDPNTLKMSGIRVLKYAPDYNESGTFNPDNDYVFFRYADVILMRAEALLRKGNSADAIDFVNMVRNNRIEPDDPFATLTLDNLLDERGRELYWEGWRRQDLIRFGKFLDARETKPASNVKYLVYPIPATQLAVNPNLKQNPGY